MNTRNTIKLAIMGVMSSGKSTLVRTLVREDHRHYLEKITGNGDTTKLNIVYNLKKNLDKPSYSFNVKKDLKIKLISEQQYSIFRLNKDLNELLQSSGIATFLSFVSEDEKEELEKSIIAEKDNYESILEVSYEVAKNLASNTKVMDRIVNGLLQGEYSEVACMFNELTINLARVDWLLEDILIVDTPGLQTVTAKVANESYYKLVDRMYSEVDCLILMLGSVGQGSTIKYILNEISEKNLDRFGLIINHSPEDLVIEEYGSDLGFKFKLDTSNCAKIAARAKLSKIAGVFDKDQVALMINSMVSGVVNKKLSRQLEFKTNKIDIEVKDNFVVPLDALLEAVLNTLKAKVAGWNRDSDRSKFHNATLECKRFNFKKGLDHFNGGYYFTKGESIFSGKVLSDARENLLDEITNKVIVKDIRNNGNKILRELFIDQNLFEVVNSSVSRTFIGQAVYNYNLSNDWKITLDTAEELIKEKDVLRSLLIDCLKEKVESILESKCSIVRNINN